MVRRRRDISKVAENAALLAAHAAGVVAPISPAVGLLRALRGVDANVDDEAFVERVLDGIDRWCTQRHREVVAVGGMPSEWRERLKDRLVDRPPADREAAAEFLSKTLFTALIVKSEQRCMVLCRELADDLDEILVTAADRQGIYAALLAVLRKDILGLQAVLDGMDPAVAREGDRALVIVYLSCLADRRGVDSWTAGRRREPTELVAVQQKLRLRDARRDDGPVSVDELLGTCARLVVLGGPGTGKSWTTRRAVIRSAQAALEALEAGAELDEVELPLAAACSKVLGPSDHSRWDRLITASLAAAAIRPVDSDRLKVLLGRHPKVLVVLDGLDEAETPEKDAIGELVDQTDTRRVVVTSRPGSWNDQFLHLTDADTHHRIGTLEPFTPDEVRKAVAAWLGDLPDTRDRLLARFEANPVLREQARVPLVCALYCLTARPDPAWTGNDPFDLFQPGRLLDLYDQAIRRILAGDWRDIIQRPTPGQLKAAVGWLEKLALDNTDTDASGNGLGAWADAVTPRHDPPPGTASHVDHIATPEPDDDNFEQARRFVHRSFHEHLVAKALRHKPPDEVAELLAQHLWFDPDWEQTIPAAIAAHPQCDDLIHHFADRITAITGGYDPTHTLDDVLTKAAVYTVYEADTVPRRSAAAAPACPSPDRTPGRDAAINRAIRSTLETTEPARWGATFSAVAHWPAVGTARDRLLDLLDSDDVEPHKVGSLFESLVELAPDRTQAARGFQRMVDLLANGVGGISRNFADVLAVLAVDVPDGHDVANQILDLLARDDLNPSAVNQLADVLAVLAVDVPDGHDVANQILDLLARDDLNPSVVNQLALAFNALTPGMDADYDPVGCIADLLARDDIEPQVVCQLASRLVALAPNSAEVQHAAERILDRLENDNLGGTGVLARALEILAPSVPDGRDIASRVIDLLATAPSHGYMAQRLPYALRGLAPSVPDDRDIASRVIDLLATGDLELGLTSPFDQAFTLLASDGNEHAQRIVDLLASSDVTPDAARQLAEMLSVLAPGLRDGHDLTGSVADLLDTVEAEGRTIKYLAETLAALAPNSAEAQRGAQRILGLLDADDHPWTAALLARSVAVLAPNSAEAQRGAQRLLDVFVAYDFHPEDAVVGAVPAVVALTPRVPARDLAGRILDLLEAPDLDWGAARLLAWAFSHLASDLQPQRVDRLAPKIPVGHNLAWRLVELFATVKLGEQTAERLASALVTLAPGLRDGHGLAGRVVDLLATPDLEPCTAKSLLKALPALAPTGTEALRGAQRALDLLGSTHTSRRGGLGWLARSLTPLAPSLPDGHDLASDVADLLDDVEGGDAHLIANLAGLLAALAPNPTDAQRGAKRILEVLETNKMGSLGQEQTKALAHLRTRMTFEQWTHILASVPNPDVEVPR